MNQFKLNQYKPRLYWLKSVHTAFCSGLTQRSFSGMGRVNNQTGWGKDKLAFKVLLQGRWVSSFDHPALSCASLHMGVGWRQDEWQGAPPLLAIQLLIQTGFGSWLAPLNPLSWVFKHCWAHDSRKLPYPIGVSVGFPGSPFVVRKEFCPLGKVSGGVLCLPHCMRETW